MSDTLLIDQYSRHVIRLWLMGKERPKTITRHRWALLKNAETATITFAEMGAIVDCCGGPRIIDLLNLGKESDERVALELIIERR